MDKFGLPKQWPHAPLHVLNRAGVYIVTASTIGHEHFFRTTAKLDLLQCHLLELAERYEWKMQAWAVLSNHYHFVAQSPERPETLSKFINHLHSTTAREINALDNRLGRRIWFQYWDLRIDSQKSYLNRLAYVDQNAVRHGLVTRAEHYPWCSATWFIESSPASFVNTVRGMPIDSLKLRDVSDPVLPDDFKS